jgi:uncharacterized damage-inducible protein DinB
MANIEPWLRGTLSDVEPVKRAVLHALELAEEDVEKWCGTLSEEDLFARPCELPHVAFQLRHIIRSLDRLLTYAKGEELSADQIVALKSEMEVGLTADVFAEFRGGMKRASVAVLAIAPESFAQVRRVGKKMLPTTVAGLLIHCADHTQRHVGQMVTTVKVLHGK